jgi:FkbM family methyltransferase
MPLRALLSDNAKVWIRGGLSKLGIEIGAYTGSFAEHRTNLINRGKVSTVWDIGAHVGQYGARLLSNGYRGRIVSVEPSARSFADLCRRASGHPGWTVIELALSDTVGQVILNLSANGQSSSLLSMNSLHISADPNSEYIGSQVVQSTTLDILEAELAPMAPFYIKLDVQGGELAVLRGATHALAAASACEVELSLTELYEGQGSWQDVVAFLASSGFGICDMERVFADPTSGDLLQVNALLRRGR